jgi:SAM-dependent methyltransferase
MKLSEDFTRREKFADLGRWYITRFVGSVAAALPRGARVLDAGAGECAYKRYFDHCRYQAVDLGVGEASWNYTNLDSIARLDQLPFATGSFDAVVSTQVLEHLDRPVESLAEMHRVLRDGGKLYLTAPMAHPEHQVPYDFFRYTSYGLRSVMKEAGFESCEIEPFGGLAIRWAYELPRAMELFPGSGLASGRPSLRGIALLPVRVVTRAGIAVLQRLLAWADRFDERKNDPFGWRVVAVKGEAAG